MFSLLPSTTFFSFDLLTLNLSKKALGVKYFVLFLAFCLQVEKDPQTKFYLIIKSSYGIYELLVDWTVRHFLWRYFRCIGKDTSLLKQIMLVSNPAK